MSRKKSPLIDAAADEYLGLKKPKAAKTYAAYQAILTGAVRRTKRMIGRPMVQHFHGRRCDEITGPEMTDWYNQRIAGAAQATKHRISKNARAVLRYWHGRGYTKEDLSFYIEKQPEGEGRVDWLEWAEIHALLDKVGSLRLKFAIAWLFYTGCRISEAVRADQLDVQWDSKRGLYVWTIVAGKTHRPRIIWLPAALSPMIEETRALNKPAPRAPLLWGCAGRGLAHVDDPTRRIAISTLVTTLRDASVEAGINKHVTPHVAKHSYCTLWIEDQGDGERSLTKLAHQVGTTVANLRKTYVHLDATDEEVEIIRAFGAR